MKVVVAWLVVLALASSARADDGPWDPGTMDRQVGGAVVGGLLVGSVAGAIGLVAGASVGNTGNWGAPVAGGAIGFAVGGLVGIVGGVQYVGDARGGDGSLLATSLGELGGLLTLAGFELLCDHLDWHPSFYVHASVGLVSVIGGPIIGYQATY